MFFNFFCKNWLFETGSKFYVEDNRYKKFLNNLQELIDNKEEFYRWIQRNIKRYKRLEYGSLYSDNVRDEEIVKTLK